MQLKISCQKYLILVSSTRLQRFMCTTLFMNKIFREEKISEEIRARVKETSATVRL